MSSADCSTCIYLYIKQHIKVFELYMQNKELKDERKYIEK